MSTAPAPKGFCHKCRRVRRASAAGTCKTCRRPIWELQARVPYPGDELKLRTTGKTYAAPAGDSKPAMTGNAESLTADLPQRHRGTETD